MPLSLKLHRIHIEVGHFIAESRGKLVPYSAIIAKFPGSHRVAEALWTLIEQRVVVEPRDFKGSYQLSQEGAALIDESWAKLQAELAAGEDVPEVPPLDAKKDLAEAREHEEAVKASRAVAPTPKAATPTSIKIRPPVAG